jgi:hypothetical protein
MTRVLLGFLLLASGALSAQQQKDEPLPTDEVKLFQFGQNHMNRGAWQQADRAFRAYLDKFPEGKQAEAAYNQLGYVHLWYSHNHAAAREWFAKLCAKFPKSPSYWQYRMQIAQSYAYQQLREQAEQEYMKISKETPDANLRAQAIQQAWGMRGKHLYLHVNQSFTAGQEPVASLQLQKIDKVAFRAFHIPFDRLLEHLGGKDRRNLQAALEKVGPDGRRLVKEWTATYTYAKNNDWKQEQVRVPSTESGVYILEAVHEEVAFSVTLFVTRYGLIAKAAAGKLVCFAQDRATSKPVEGMTIKALGETTLEGATDASGLFITTGFKGGAIVGVKDREIVTTESHYSGGTGGQPLIYVTTDRPIYRPNQTVNFRVVFRRELGQKLEVRPGEKLTIEIRDPKGNLAYEKSHAVNEFGSTQGQIILGDEPALGEYTVTVRPEKGDPEYNAYHWRWNAYVQNFGKFRVDEYRKPEYKVDVDFKRAPVLQGENVEAAIQARYYFGSPVVDADVTYTVYRRGHWWAWRCWAYYYDWYYEDEDDSYGGKRGRWWYGHGEQVFQGTGKTDKEGKLDVRFTAAKWDHDAIYTVVARVTDLSRRMVEGEGACKATRAEFGLAMSLSKYVYRPGEKINVKVRAATADDKPVIETAVALKAYDRRWANQKHEDSLVFEGFSRTDGQGVAEFNLAPDREGGYLWIVAEARDRRENRVTAEHYAWLCGNSWYGDHVNLNGVDLVLDKKTYDLGETAQIMVTSQFKNVTLLFTVEGKEIHKTEVLAMKGHTKMIELPIDQSVYAPNVYVSVTAIKENALVQKRRMLIVNPSERFFTVEIRPDKGEYRPRQKARYEILTRGADGRPVAAEVALGIVDESIYALQDEYGVDIRKHFIHRRGVEVATTSSLQYYDWGRADAREKDGAKPAAAPAKAEAPAEGLAMRKSAETRNRQEGKEQSYAATEIRSNFADTMLWKTVVTGPDGRAVVEVDIPDNLTTWRATARAVTADSRFGQESNSVVCRKSMIVRLETPRFFTQNDRTIVSAIAHNYLVTEKEVRVEFAAEGIETEGARERIVKVAAGGQVRIDWKATIVAAGSAKITVKALSDEDSDAMQLTVPVLAHGAMKWDSRAGIVKERVVEKVRLPEGSIKDASELVIVISPTHASMVLEALDYLAGYPYGCVEQTMSRFLPTVVVSGALQKLGISKPELQKEIPFMVAAGLQRLYNFQQPDGGWGWWQHDQSNPWTTAYVVSGLAMARAADHAVDPNVLQRGIQSLQAHLAKSAKADEQAYLLHALSVAGVRNDPVRDRLTDKLGEIGSYGKALLALVLHKDGRNAKEALESLAKDAKEVGSAVHFDGGGGYGWMDHAVEVTAAALRAFLKVDPKHDLVPKMAHWLSLARQGNYWASTKQTAMAVFAITEYLAATGEADPDMTVTLSLNGDRVFSERVTKENWQQFESMRRFKASQLNVGDNEIAIEKTGKGTPAWSFYIRYYAQEEDLQPSKGGIRVERSYARVRNAGGKRELEKLSSGAEIVSGDEIEVTLTVSADRNYEWLMLEDPLPSGFEAIREYYGAPGRHGHGRHTWGWWYSRKEFRDEKVSIAMTTLGRGTHTATYVMRAETPGDFHVLPAGVFNMYHPEIGGNSAEFRLRVVDRK